MPSPPNNRIYPERAHWPLLRAGLVKFLVLQLVRRASSGLSRCAQMRAQFRSLYKENFGLFLDDRTV